MVGLIFVSFPSYLLQKTGNTVFAEPLFLLEAGRPLLPCDRCTLKGEVT